MPVSADRILYSDDHVLIVNKLSGELVVRGKGKVGKLPLLDFLKKTYPGLRAVHRLDFETSGVVVFARTKQAYESILNTKFARWKKIYHALVMGSIEREGGVIHLRLPARGKGMVDAVTRYKVLDRFANSSLVEAQIETGRHHQIRRHFAMIRHPLALDDLYGHKKFNQLFSKEMKYWNFFLHAARLELPHPVTGEQLTIAAPMPKAFTDVLKKLRA